MISQTLCKTKDGAGRVAAHEIMLGTAAIRNLIRESKVAQMYSAIQTGNSVGMQTLDQNLADLVRRNIVVAGRSARQGEVPGELPRAEPARGAPIMERDQASKFVNDLLRLMVSRNGSDLFLTADFPPAIKVDGKVTKVSPQPLTGQHTLALTRSIMNDKQAAEFERTQGVQLRGRAAGHRPLPRQRLRAAGQRRPGDADDPAGRCRRSTAMNLPHVLKDVAMTKRGLVHLRRRHRLGQEHVARGDGRPPQRELVRPHHHDRGPGRVRASAQELHRHAARGRHRHRRLGGTR